ncbi:eukaryotic translation initiation factor 4B-like isoform X3 [Argopecten irradians]|uniref:eukaryotic translation initiation factor 4B-like isoform X3 n=1 Tax=Argopecten irradians TaxID=31199 RepID=UPI003720B12E
MAAQGKKKQKMKGTKMALTDFLSNEKSGGAPESPSGSYGGGSGGGSYGGRDRSYGKVDSWAAEMDSLSMDDMGDMDYAKPMIDRSKLPTAPKASRGPDVDMSKVPSSPPFTAFIGNLPYEASERSIEDFFQNLNVANVRLPNDGGRLRGFGYVEFADRQSLIDALSMNDETMGGRQIRVDLAGQNQQNAGGDRGGFDKRENDGPDRTDSDWRRRDPQQDNHTEPDRSSASGRWSSNRDRDDRGPPSRGGYDNDRGFERGPPRGGGGFSRYEEAPPSRDRYDDRGPSRGFDDRGPSRGFRDDRGPSRGYDRYDDRGGRDGGYGDGGRRGYGGYRNDNPDNRYGNRYDRSSQEPSQEGPKERPRLNLQPRTKPVEEPVKTEAVPKPKPAENRSASIFGNAKPVDTAAKEREIEERLKRKEEEFRRGNDEEKENRNFHNNSQHSGPGRTRHDSTDKMEGRQRRLSSGSSGKGRPGPHPITSPSRSRRDSEISNNSAEVFSGGEDGSKDTPKSPTTPTTAQREEVKLVPAPPPSVNIWEKRKTDGPQTTPPKSESKSAPQTETSQLQASQPAPSAWGRGRRIDGHSEDAPTGNAWGKKSHHDKPHDHHRQGDQHRPSGRGGNAWGRGAKSQPREKVLPKSIDEMPKLENKSKQDWSDKNKFSSLLEDEDDN